jgi:hypothetical protein
MRCISVSSVLSFPRVRRAVRRGLTAACGMAVLAAGSGVVRAQDSNPLLESGRLRMEARLAAEEGEFAKAADLLRDAAISVGDRVTADRAEQLGNGLEAGGGAQVDFQSLMQLIMDQTSPPALWIQQGDDIGSMTPFFQGVFVGVPAIASAVTMTQDNSALVSAAEFASTANHNSDVRVSSDLRLVSLPRLEAYVQSQLALGQSVPQDAANLAGLTRIQFLFVFPRSGDVVIGGPAADWKLDADGRSVSVVNNRPTLQLDDLITLSRTFSDRGPGFLMCSIDPKPEQVRAVREFAAANRNLDAGDVREFTEELEQMLGLQNVIVQGVPRDSRVADVIVDADYQMKRIGIGEREGAPGMKSYFDLAGRQERKGSAMDALRWWMTVGYDSIQVSPDRLSFEFAGQTVQCQSENQIVSKDGSRTSTGKADGANEKFAQLFTEHLPALAETDVVFADLQNVFDLALATALIHSQGLDRIAGWQSEFFAQGGAYDPAPVDVPSELMTAANCRVYRGGDVLIQVAGGVRGDLNSIVRDPAKYQTDDQLVGPATEANPIGQSGRWWWDAASR